jgi:FixJ family two-component response regulator
MTEKDYPRGPVYLVDDDESFRRSTSRLLSLSGFTVRDFSSVGDFMMGFSRDSIGCLLLDLRMPGPNGMELLEHLSREAVGPPVVFLTGHGDVTTAVSAMRTGAFDFLTKPIEKSRLLDVVQRALLRSQENCTVAERRRNLRERFQTLTPTEKDVYRLVVEGLPNKAIAEHIGNAERTVKLHRSNLSRKLGAQCVADLVRFHYEANLDLS